jgi:UDP-N-acetyl-D-galactosamine dehydrogenase
MITHDKKIKDANVLVMGLTFKEDCPDIRNSKVFDIIDELADYGCRVDAYEPWIDEKDLEQQNFTFIPDPFRGDKKYDATIVAVGHRLFRALSRNDFESISEGEAVLIDIKGIVEDPTWRL